MASSLSAPLSEGQCLAARVAFGAIVGGTVEEIGGGKFANGAVTGSFTVAYNELMHSTYSLIRQLAGIEDIIQNGRMYDSNIEASRMAKLLVSAFNNEVNVISVTNSKGEKSYFLDSSYNNTPKNSNWNSDDNLIDQGYTITSATHYSLMRPLDPVLAAANVLTVSKDDFLVAQVRHIPITHVSIGLGQWNIDTYGLTSRFIPEDFRNLGNYQINFFNATNNR